MKSRARDWLAQAENDLQYALHGLKNHFYSQVCFISQQAAEKAVKSIAYKRSYEIRGHSIALIAKELGINGEILDAAKLLDTFYISSRYPDALPDGAPFEIFTRTQADSAVSAATLIIDKAKDELK